MLRLMFAAAFLSLAAPALAGSEADVDAAVSANVGDPAAVHAAFDAIQAAVADDDAAALADWVSYPIDVRVGGETRHLTDAEAFVAAYPDIITEDIAAAITDQDYANLFVNAQGAMFGNGEVWLAGVCSDDACADPAIRIITIQDAK